MKDATYAKFVDRWKETTDLPPTSVGPATPVYKMVTARLKVMPWPLLILAGIAFAAALFAIFGPAVTFIVSLLQRGF